MVLPLAEACRDVWCCVTRIDTDMILQRQLCAFGLVPGTRVRRRYDSPAGDVSAIELRGSMIALRKRDLHRIWVCM